MRRSLPACLAVACVVVLALISFGRALFQGEQFAYRDAAHFYYPLYQFVQAEWDAGRIPLWEPHENGGMPLLGNPTAAVLYPGKLIYAALPYAWGARLYVVAHALLACFAMAALMRHWGASWAAAGVAAASYGFAAPVLFQYCNIIFLVGAAWLPLGFRAADRWLRQGRRWGVVELALVLALQTLGGDPESAYVLGVCAGGYALGLAWAARRPARPAGARGLASTLVGGSILTAVWIAATLFMASWAPGWRVLDPVPEPLPWIAWFHRGVLIAWGLAGIVLVARRLKRGPSDRLGTMVFGLAGAAALATALMAAQLLPVMEFTGRSLRAAGGIAHDVYPFSLEPARWLGLVWPNFYGDNFTHNRSWFSLLPPTLKHAQVWGPSLYLGGATLVLALGAAGFRGGPPWRAWLTGVAVVASLGSLGDYSSPLWWARWSPEVVKSVGPHEEMYTSAIRKDGFLRDGDGGVYWMMATFLPGFRQFRFPSKLLTFSTLAMAALGGLGWDRVVAGDRRRTARIAAGLVALSLAGLAYAAIRRAAILRFFSPSEQGGSPFGPIDAPGAYGELVWALAQGLVVLGATLALTLWRRRAPARAGAALLVLVTADLALANPRYILTVPQRYMDTETVPKVVKLIEEAERKDPAGQPFRVHRMPLWNPRHWNEAASDDRVKEFVVWERDTIQPKYGLAYGVHYTSTFGVSELYDYEWFFAGFWRTIRDPAVSKMLGVPVGDRVVYLPRRGFDLWNTRYFVVPANPNGWKDEFRAYASFLNDTEQIYPPPDTFSGADGREAEMRWIMEEDVRVLRNRSVYPRAWVVHQARFHRPATGLDRTGRQGPIQELLYAHDPFWTDPDIPRFNPHEVVWLETDRQQVLAGKLSGSPPLPRESVRITDYSSQRVELEVDLRQPGVVVLADVYYPGWKLTIDGAAAPIERANFLMRGAVVEAGRHRLVYTYEPESFRVGGWISLAGLAGLAGVGAWFARRPLSPGLAGPAAENHGVS